MLKRDAATSTMAVELIVEKKDIPQEESEYLRQNNAMKESMAECAAKRGE